MERDGVASVGGDGPCTLLSISCTTGGLDWMHGDLWLCPDGLLRRSRGWRATFGNVGMMGVKDSVDYHNRPSRTFSEPERQQIVSSDKRNVWIPWALVSRAKLSSGPMSHGLRLELTDGRKVKLEWLGQDGPIDFVRAALASSLGERLSR